MKLIDQATCNSLLCYIIFLLGRRRYSLKRIKTFDGLNVFYKSGRVKICFTPDHIRNLLLLTSGVWRPYSDLVMRLSRCLTTGEEYNSGRRGK